MSRKVTKPPSLADVAKQTDNWIKGKNDDWWRKNCPHAIHRSIKYSNATNPIPKLKPEDCPKFQVPVYGDDEDESYVYGTRIEVVNADAFEQAIALMEGQESNDPFVAVLNLANPFSPGGGWLGGAKAQEEYLCFRSTLSAALKKEYYPISDASGIYSPAVAIIRSSDETGYQWIKDPKDYPIVSVLTVAAKSGPNMCTKPKLKNDTYTPSGYYYADPAEAELLREKIRIALRMAVYHGHSRIVLGAIGCGVFGNPKERVAELFFHVFMEEEFSGGWFEHIVFAVKDQPKANIFGSGSNFDVFFRKLHGVVV